MEKQIELGCFRATLQEDGLTFSPMRDKSLLPDDQWNKRLNALQGEIWLSPESVDKLKKWLDNSGSSELYGGKTIVKKESKID